MSSGPHSFPWFALADELAKVCRDPMSARFLALRAGFPIQHLPPFETPHGFWHLVVRDAYAGRISLQALVEEAIARFPSNAALTAFLYAVSASERVALPGDEYSSIQERTLYLESPGGSSVVSVFVDTRARAPGTGGPLTVRSRGHALSSLCLNSWFPGHPDVFPEFLVGTRIRLCINLGPARVEASTSTPLPADVIQGLHEAPSVDILVTCAGADIVPFRSTLRMPPDPDHILEFTLTPLRPGPLEIHLVLLIHNEPIHRTIIDADAVAVPNVISSEAPRP